MLLGGRFRSHDKFQALVYDILPSKAMLGVWPPLLSHRSYGSSSVPQCGKGRSQFSLPESTFSSVQTLTAMSHHTAPSPTPVLQSHTSTHTLINTSLCSRQKSPNTGSPCLDTGKSVMHTLVRMSCWRCSKLRLIMCSDRLTGKTTLNLTVLMNTE